MRTALRTALAAALVAGVAATPVLATGSAFAAGTNPAPKAAAAPAAAQDTPVRTVQLGGGLSAAVYARGDQHPYYTADVISGGTVLGELKAGAGYPSQDTQVFAGYAVTLTSEGEVTAVAQDGTLVRTVQVAEGLSAMVYARGDQHPYYTATVVKDGTVLGELKAGAGYPSQDTQVFAGYSVTLTSEGEVTSFAANGTLVRTVQLAGGLSAKVYARGDQHRYFTADVVEGGTVLGELKAGAGYPPEDTQVFAGYAVTLTFEGEVTATAAPGTGAQGASASGGTGASAAKDKLGPCTVSTTVSIGAGTAAELFMTRQGPVAEFSAAGEDRVFAMVDRAHPSLPKSAGITARIVDPKSATPSLYTKVEGGTAKGSTRAFPKLPKGCAFEVPIETGTKGATGAKSATGAGTGLTTNTVQTSVIPQGGVAAGAEFTAEGDSTALIAAGAGAASLAAAGLGFVVLRRRAGADRV
ncbi:hypothetical protein AB0F57_02490 [Streptomyces tanashiensis]|uniref:hypothetical protein n=1 Tax=Streptomyces tanashiensis TaxID=67367 RepID=UPI0033C4422C